MIKISIVTVCYNSFETIEDTIGSVLSQNYTNIYDAINKGLAMADEGIVGYLNSDDF